MVDIIVDGKTLSVDEKGNLITELKKYGIEIPHFCYHEALGVSGNCRMCLIEVVGQKRPQIACDMPITAGMEIKINSDLTRKVQRGLLELEFINHPLDCPVCDQAGECALQEYYMKFDKQDSKVKLVDKVQKAKKQDF
ncbi:MAG: 2Fe-2S iron-sulfur cluster-binding protein, partial [Campylobacter hyointestinalis]